MKRDSGHTVVIIGGGFSGSLVAVHLLRMPAARRRRIVLIERGPRPGRGVAHGTFFGGHLLNVVACRMGAYPDDDEGFHRYAAARDARVTAASFLPRRIYGDYIEHLVREAIANASPGCRLEHVAADATALEVDERAGRVRVRLRGRLPITADRVVLALGNYPPADPPVPDSAAFYRDRRYVRDPWRPGALDSVAGEDRVLLIGTGLTMFDVLLALRARGLTGTIDAISRHGLLPRWHRSPPIPPVRDQQPPGLDAPPYTVRGLLRAVRKHAAERNIDWRDVINSLRPITPKLWQGLDETERRRFLRHLRPWWDVHRHRAAPVTGGAIERLIETGTLVVHAGRLRRLHATNTHVHVEYTPRHEDSLACLHVDRVVNCTGPYCDTRRPTDPLLRSLVERGLVRSDSLGLGLETTDDLAAVDAEGRASMLLYVVGPMLRGRDWEAIAVPELRVHALRAAQSVVASLAEQSGTAWHDRSAAPA